MAYHSPDDDLTMSHKFYLPDMCIVTLMPGGANTICGDLVWYAYSNGIIYSSTHTRFRSPSLGASTGSFFAYKYDMMTPISVIQAGATPDEVRWGSYADFRVLSLTLYFTGSLHCVLVH